MSDILETCLPDVRIPSYGDNVYKDECLFCYDTAKSEGGLYICLSSFLGFGSRYVNFYHEITKKRIFLRMKKVKKEQPVSDSNEQSPMEKKPKRFAIGVEGGFNPDATKEEYDDVNTIVVLPDHIELPFEAIDEANSKIVNSANAVLSMMSVSKKDESMAWDGEIRQPSKHAMTLKQIDNGRKIPPSGWKCDNCELCNNLWLNLTDGHIGCGRRYFDGTGGNEHGVQHYKDTGYPLAVKLGTITAHGADVFSYEEDTMVEDPLLAEHLAHFGINMMSMQKTEQTMAELEIELNEKLGSEWDIIQEAGKKLKELHGPGLTGLENMGNTCYMNSLLQVLYSTNSFLKNFTSVDMCAEKFKSSLRKLNFGDQGWSAARTAVEIHNTVQDISEDMQLQLCKLGMALYGGPHTKEEYSNGEEVEGSTKTKEGVRPVTLKKLVGKGHIEFSSCKQQDVHEYLLHMLSLLEKMATKHKIENPGSQFQFTAEERIECQETKHVRYTNRSDFAISLPVPMECTTNPAEVAAYEQRVEANKKDVNFKVGPVVRSRIPFQSCLESYMADEVIEDFWSASASKKVSAHKCSRMTTFPDYLIIQLKKFTVGLDWVPKKLDVSVSMPDELDINCLRGRGMQPNETALPEGGEPKPEPAVNEAGMTTLMDMGFPQERAKQALLANNNNVEMAAMWLFENPASDPPPVPAADDVPEDAIAMVMSMGFPAEQARHALKQTSNNVERAIDWIFSHPDEVGPSESDQQQQQSNNESSTPPGVTDGPGNYELLGFISHMGTSTLCGHYVCHIKKNGKWVIFNDEKVAESEEPPKDLGYLYFYKRKDV